MTRRFDHARRHQTVPLLLLFHLSIFTLLFFIPPALAQRAKIAVVLTEDTIDLTRKLGDELRVLGYEVIRIETESDEVYLANLNQLAERASADAAIHVRIKPDVFEIRVASPHEKHVLSQTLSRTHRETEPSEVAVSAVEFMRAAMLADKKPTPAKKEPTSPSATQPTPTSPEQPTKPDRLFIATGLAATAPYFHGLPLFEFQIGLDVRLQKQFSLNLFGQLPMLPIKFDIEEKGSANVRLWMVGGGGEYAFVDPEKSLCPYVGLGIAALFYDLTGHSATADHLSTHELVAVGAPYLQLGLRFNLTRTLSLYGSLLSAWAFSETTIKIGGKTAATMGNFVLGGTLGLRLALL